jgi:hypothetical protein
MQERGLSEQERQRHRRPALTDTVGEDARRPAAVRLARVVQGGHRPSRLASVTLGVWRRAGRSQGPVGSGRPTKAHEYVLLLAKTERYYYDMAASQEPAVADHPSGSKGRRGNHQRGRSHFGTNAPWDGVGGSRNRRSVWSASVKPPRGAHHATFPPDLVEPCIRAGTSAKGACPRCGTPWARVVMESGAMANGSPEGHWKPTYICQPAAPVPCVVLDPFAGTGSALVAALGLGRRALGCELHEAFARFGEQGVRGAVGAEENDGLGIGTWTSDEIARAKNRRSML